MPAKVRVKILAGRNLPVMDRSSDTTDAYVEVKLGSITHKTDVFRKSLNPQWNSDWYRFEVDDSELQDEPLQIRIMDHDTYSANDAIGKIYINLNPLLLPDEEHLNDHQINSYSIKGKSMTGWVPVFDTIHGIRGEVHLIVKVDLFTDVNKFRQSSCGVQFFYTPSIPYGYQVQVIHGFVEELMVDDDPEHHWIDKIRSPRASNEARQLIFFKMAGQVQRRVGLKAIDLGANAVIGYNQCFDLEGDIGIVARGIGTAVTLIKIPGNQQSQHEQILAEEGDGLSTSPKAGNLAIDNKAQLTTSKSPSRGHQIPGAPRDHSGRRSSDSDISVTPLVRRVFRRKRNSLGTSDRPTAGVLRGFGVTSLKNPINQENIDMLEYPFLTMSIFPHGFIEHIGGAVAARSVKLLERVANPEEPESRDAWWNELRMEIRSHCRTLGCNFVLGYSEATSISDDVCVLSATGTAAVINVKFAAGEITTGELAATKEHGVLAHRDDKDKDLKDIPESTVKGDCSLCHLPFSTKSMPYEMKPYMCAVCHKSPVSDLLISTIELPDNVPISGLGTLIHAQVCRPKNSVRSESNAKEISDGIPFLEYDLYRLLINKVRSKGMNAIFGFKTFLSVGEKMIVLAASGTGVYLSALPQPDIPKIAPGNTWTDLAKLNDLQKSLQEAVDRNKEYYQLKPYFDETASSEGIQEGQSAEEDLVEMDLNHGSKNTCILEVDDIEDLDIISLLLEPCPPEGFYITTTQNIPGLNGYEISHNLQYFSQVWRVKNQTTSQGRNFPKHLVRLLQTIFFKLRAMTPCAICNLRLRVAVPNTEEIEFVVSGMTLSLEEIPRAKHQPRELSASDTKKNNDEDLMFKMDEETANDQEQGAVGGVGALTHTRSLRLNSESPIRAKFSSMRISKQIPLKERFGVDITPLNYIPSGRIDKYLGNLNFFLIRETSSLRDAGGLSGFTHGFIMELLAIVRAHVAALGGNAMTSFSISEFSLADNPHKGQGQCLVSVTGDVVFVSYSGSE